MLRNGATGRKYQVETLPGGLGVIDFDGDGWPDLFCTNGAQLPELTKSGPEYWNRLYRNNRDGTFSDVTAKAGLQGEGYSMGVAVGDYNNDGHEDLFVAGVHGNHLYRNNGRRHIYRCDRGKRGLPDRDRWAGRCGPLRPAGSTTTTTGCSICSSPTIATGLPASTLSAAGLQADARAYCHPDKYHAEPMQLYHNNGNGTFTEVTHKAGLAGPAGQRDGPRDGRFRRRRPPGNLCRQRQRAQLAAAQSRQGVRRDRNGSREWHSTAMGAISPEWVRISAISMATGGSIS